MYIAITVLIIVVCLFLILTVLVQNPKGNGLAAGFSNIGNQVMGARKSGDVMEKATWYSVITLLVLSLASGFFIEKGAKTDAKEKQKSAIEDRINSNNLPTLPNTAPAGGDAAPAQQQEAAPTTAPAQ
jgi:preprotein translocase subunit SecG